MKFKPTNEQKQIIKHVAGHAMVKAGPGCAKTSTLALRIRRLLEIGCDPENIVIMTYTDALTEDIKQTLAELFGNKKTEQITVKTIHGFAYQLVNRYYEAQGLLQPKVLTIQKKKRLIQCYGNKYDLKISELNKAFYGFETGNDQSIVTALGKEKAKYARSAYKAYSRHKQKHNKIDFEDMIEQALQLLRSVPTPASLLGGYQHLMVDELQDINGP